MQLKKLVFSLLLSSAFYLSFSQGVERQEVYLIYNAKSCSKHLETNNITFNFGIGWTDSNSFVYEKKHNADTLNNSKLEYLDIVTIHDLYSRGEKTYKAYSEKFKAKHGFAPLPPINNPHQYFNIYILEKIDHKWVRYPVKWIDAIP
jgi:hypothetical protein